MDSMSLRVFAGQVHALAGANGAGKSTLLKMLAGHVRPDSGLVRIAGDDASILRPTDATRLGLNFIHQELNLVPKFTVLDNLILGHPDAGHRGLLTRSSLRQRARSVIDRLGVDLDLSATVEQLTTHQQWTVALGHALMRDAKVLAMDEPTASLAEAEVDHLLRIVKELAASGCAIIYVSHRLEEILEITDQVTVMRDGRLVGSWPTHTIDRGQLTRHIVGRDVPEIRPPEVVFSAARPILELSGIKAFPRLVNVDLEIFPGEILGLAGLVGSGRTEIARIIFGADRPTAGTMTLEGQPYRPRHPSDAIRHGVALVPEQRRAQGLVFGESLTFNVNLATNSSNRIRRWWPFVSMSKKRIVARDMMQRLAIKARSSESPVDRLSGGNQQKVVVAKWLRVRPKLLILDEPTVGVDVGAREEIYGLIRSWAENGTALLLISSDFDELSLCHRVAVVREGSITKIVDGASVTKEELTRMCYEAVGAHA